MQFHQMLNLDPWPSWAVTQTQGRVCTTSLFWFKIGLLALLLQFIRWILSNKQSLRNPNGARFESLPFDFVCFRGLLVTMMSSLYDTNNDWEIHAIKFRGTVYLCAKDTDLKLVSGSSLRKISGYCLFLKQRSIICFLRVNLAKNFNV